MYLILTDYLKGTPYENKLISSEPLISKLRSRKLPQETELVKTAAELAEDVWQSAMKDIQIGMSEIQIATIIEYYILNSKNKPSFQTIVNAGDKTRPGHSAPTNAKIEQGDLLHVDFGIRHEGYCSDLQRLLYFKKEGEDKPPEDLTAAFNIVRDIITETGKISKPGIQGNEVDALARKMLTDNSYPEYQHALGHQLGRDVHDGGAILGPKWERYGITPTIPLELNNIFTLELEIMLPDIGCVGLEEDMIVTEDGAEYLCPRQMELYVK
jgi:Xaa-Pro aminopeptidase